MDERMSFELRLKVDNFFNSKCNDTFEGCNDPSYKRLVTKFNCMVEDVEDEDLEDRVVKFMEENK